VLLPVGQGSESCNCQGNLDKGGENKIFLIVLLAREKHMCFVSLKLLIWDHGLLFV
jgi:hypothetical protein